MKKSFSFLRDKSLVSFKKIKDINFLTTLSLFIIACTIMAGSVVKYSLFISISTITLILIYSLLEPCKFKFITKLIIIFLLFLMEIYILQILFSYESLELFSTYMSKGEFLSESFYCVRAALLPLAIFIIMFRSDFSEVKKYS